MLHLVVHYYRFHWGKYTVYLIQFIHSNYAYDTNNFGREVAFVVPNKFTLETLPVPNDDRVEFAEVPAKKMAVMSFTWYAREARVERKKQEFLTTVEAAGLTPLAPPVFASYNDPFTFPLLQKHEILIEVE